MKMERFRTQENYKSDNDLCFNRISNMRPGTHSYVSFYIAIFDFRYQHHKFVGKKLFLNHWFRCLEFFLLRNLTSLRPWFVFSPIFLVPAKQRRNHRLPFNHLVILHNQLRLVNWLEIAIKKSEFVMREPLKTFSETSHFN